MNKVLKRYRWIYLLIPMQIVSALLAMMHYGFIFKSGTAVIGILILLLLYLNRQSRFKDIIPLVIAFAFSIVGDWFLSNRQGETVRFIYGILFFFVAHIGYLWYALIKGSLKGKFTMVLLMAYLLFFMLLLYPAFSDKRLMIAVLIYLIISCLSVGGAVGIKGEKLFRVTYLSGIILILFSDTIIALREFVGYHSLNALILPTYYLSHIFIAYSILYLQRPKEMGRDKESRSSCLSST